MSLLPDWNRYREQFPKRYWELGEFDEKLKQKLSYIANRYCRHHGEDPMTVLDVGGGAYGTEILKPFVSDYGWSVDLLDPFINLKPEWMNDQVGYDSTSEYDIIVCRGSINYLSINQLTKIATMTKCFGVMYANTFLNPPSVNWTERETENGAGVKGIERFRSCGDQVQHQTVFGDCTVEHEFFFHSKETYAKIFPLVGFESYGKNSMILDW